MSKQKIVGVISRDEFLAKLKSITKDISTLPERVKYPPGNELEQGMKVFDAEQAADTDTDTAQTNKAAEPPAENKPFNYSSGSMDVPRTPENTNMFAEMTNNNVMELAEEFFNFPPGTLKYTPNDQWLMNQVQPEETEIKKTWGNFWTVFGLTTISKGFRGLLIWKKRKIK